MILIQSALRRHRRATTLGLALGFLIAAGLLQGCASGRVQTATPIPNDPEFATRLNDLARNIQSLNVEKILPAYSPDHYQVSFEAPYDLAQGSPKHRAILMDLIGRMKELHVALEPGFDAWRDQDRVWTTRGFKVTGTTKDGKEYAFSGWHSAIWEQKDGQWLIWYEHFGGKPELVLPPAPPPAPAPPPPAPTPAPAATVVQLPFGDVFFDFDKWAIRHDQTATLAGNIDLLKKNPDVQILIEGHCDERAGETYNFGLGDRRAAAVRNYLVDKGINPDRLAVVSYGKQKPFEAGHDEQAWSKNRRAHFVVIKE
ncbi:MAG: OmpA family protein [Acidobacteriia bacterium]|nr:OmpA family protein [Terriglobia bacterium]